MDIFTKTKVLGSKTRIARNLNNTLLVRETNILLDLASVIHRIWNSESQGWKIPSPKVLHWSRFYNNDVKILFSLNQFFFLSLIPDCRVSFRVDPIQFFSRFGTESTLTSSPTTEDRSWNPNLGSGPEKKRIVLLVRGIQFRGIQLYLD